MPDADERVRKKLDTRHGAVDGDIETDKLSREILVASDCAEPTEYAADGELLAGRIVANRVNGRQGVAAEFGRVEDGAEAALHRPLFDEAVLRANRESFAIGRKREAINRRLRTFENEHIGRNPYGYAPQPRAANMQIIRSRDDTMNTGLGAG